MNNNMPGSKRFLSLWWLAIAFNICLVFSGVLVSLMVFIDDVAEDLQMTTAVIGSTMAINVIAFGITGPLTSYALNVVGCRTVIMIGGILLSSGIFLMAFAQNITFIGIGFSLMGGTGASAIYTAGTATIRLHYSDRHYALANGVAITGIPLSIFIFSPILRALAFVYGWRGAMVIGSAVSLNSLVIGALMKPGVIRKRKLVVYDRDEVCKVSDDAESNVNDMTNELLLRPPHPDHQPSSTALESSKSNDQESSADVGKDFSGSMEVCDISSDHKTQISFPPRYYHLERGEPGIDIDPIMEGVRGRAISDADDELHSEVSLTIDKGTFHSIVSRKDHVSYCSLSGVENDLPNDGQKTHGLKGAEVLKSAFGIAKFFKFSSKPLTRTSKICHLSLLVAVFFLAATYTTGNVFITPAGTHGGLTPMKAASLLSAFGISQAIGRFFNGILVTRGYVKAFHLFIGVQILMASSSLVLGLLMRVYAVAILSSLVFGVSAGAIISLNIVMQREIDEYATSIALGWLVFVEGFGGLFGSLALGYLKDLTDSFLIMFVLTAVFTSLSAALSGLILMLKKREAVSLSISRKEANI